LQKNKDLQCDPVLINTDLDATQIQIHNTRFKANYEKLITRVMHGGGGVEEGGPWPSVELDVQVNGNVGLAVILCCL
jgi:hypothetical protein